MPGRLPVEKGHRSGGTVLSVNLADRRQDAVDQGNGDRHMVGDLVGGFDGGAPPLGLQAIVDRPQLDVERSDQEPRHKKK